MLFLASGNLGVAWSTAFAGATTGDDLVIPAGMTVLLDVAQTPVYRSVTVNGRINVSRALDTELRTGSVDIDGGVYWVGDEASPFPIARTHKLTPSGARANEPAGNLSSPASASISNNRGMFVRGGGDLALVAEVPAVTIVKLAATANAGATSITLDSPVTWKAGKQLHLTSTDYFRSWPLNAMTGFHEETVTIAADVVNSTVVTLTSALLYRHHGAKFYVVPPAYEDVPGTNLSYTQRTILATDSFGTTSGGTYLGQRVLDAAAAGASTVFDNRCTVGYITQPIKFAGPLDADWTTHGYGAHMMVMGLTSKARLQGVEFNRVGQAGMLGRYPFHHHMRSYTPYGQVGSGTLLGDVDGAANFIRKCSISNSSNRAITIHGTNGSVTQQNVIVNTDTHAIFTEDGSERRNVIDGNLVSRVNQIGYGKIAIKAHDIANFNSEQVTYLEGPSGIWYTNPDNYLRNNICMGGWIGIWNAFSDRCFGQSRDVAIDPSSLPILQHSNNEMGCQGSRAMQTTGPVIDELGTLGNRTSLKLGDKTRVFTQLYEDQITDVNMWKPYSQWYANQVIQVRYSRWRISGIGPGDVALGNGTIISLGIMGVANGAFDGCLLSLKTLDDEGFTPRGSIMTAYNGSMRVTNSIVIGAPPSPLTSNVGPGNASTPLKTEGCLTNPDDLYNFSIELKFRTNINNAIIGASPGVIGFFNPPHWMLASEFGIPATTYDFALQPVARTKGEAAYRRLPDDGSMFGMAGSWVYDHPFVTYGTSGGVVAKGYYDWSTKNGVILPSSYEYYSMRVYGATATLTAGTPGATGADNAADGDVYTKHAINYTRLQTDAVTPVVGGTWNTPSAQDPTYGYQNNYPNMRHAAAAKGGTYTIGWSRTDVPLPKNLDFEIIGMWSADSNFVVSVDFDGTQAINKINFGARVFTAHASKTALLANRSVNGYWRDTTNNKLWINVYGNDGTPYGTDYDVTLTRLWSRGSNKLMVNRT